MESNNLYDLQDEPLRLNRFVCDIEMNGKTVDYRVVRGFFEDYISQYLYIDIAQYKGNDYEWLFTEAYCDDFSVEAKCDCKVTMTSLSPDFHKVKHVEYKVSRVANIIYPKYEYDNDGLAVYKVVLKYDKRDITYFRGESKFDIEASETRYKCDWDAKPTGIKAKQEKPELSKNDKAYLKASVELLEDAKKRVKEKYSQYDNTEETMNSVLNSIDKAENEAKTHAEELGCTENDMKNAKYKEPNGLEVEKYKRRLEKIKISKPSYMFGDFATAMEWYKHHMIPDWRKGYVDVPKYEEVDNDIIQNTRPTVVVCSRQCGMTTHMLTWSLAYISSCIDAEIWYVTHDREMIFEMIKNMPDEVKKLDFLKFSFGWTILENTETNSKIRFVSINQNLPDFFCGKELPDYVIYDNMAFYPAYKLNEFLNLMDMNYTNKHRTKEICVSTPSKGGSIFNFIALTAPNPIRIPWYEVNMSEKDKDEAWAQQMKELIGEENFNIECNCQIGSDDDYSPDFKNRFSFLKNFFDYDKFVDEKFAELDNGDWDWFEVKDGEDCCKCESENECCGYKHGFPEDYKKLNKCGHKPFKKERLPEDYGYCFNDNEKGNSQFGNDACVGDDKEYEIEI